MPWPVLTYGPTPSVATKDWQLTIDGEVNKPITLDWAAFNKLRHTMLNTDIHCVTRWSRFGVEWGGIGLDDLLAAARIRS